MTTQLSDHFTLEELTRSDTAVERGIDNTPTPEALDNLTHKTAFSMEYVRSLFNLPIAVSSGFRCDALNKIVGGVAISAHTRGLAVDFTIPSVELMDVYKAIRDSQIDYDQLIFENTWLHIGFDVPGRRQNLVMYHENGQTLYKPGP